jgi:hypothetical protein
MPGKLIAVYTAQTSEEAYLLKNLLAEVGIRAVVDNADLQNGLVGGWPMLPRVLVDEEDLHAAEEIARRFDKRAPLEDAVPEEIAPQGDSDGDTDTGEESAEEEPSAASRGLWTLLVVAMLAGAAMKVLVPLVRALAH